MHFGSDNTLGASPRILEAIIKANGGHQPSYGEDAWCAAARSAIAEVFDRSVQVYFVSTGTVANSLALAALVPPWGAVLCQNDAHVVADESTAPELFSGGARFLPLDPVHGKLNPESVDRLLSRGGHPPHHAQPSALTITQCNERGLVYTPDELAALTAVAKRHGISVHMDGARFANAVAALKCDPADITWRAGIDVLTLGASKNGALMAEAVVFFEPDLAKDFTYRIKRAGQMAAKSRFFGAQFDAWLRDDHWLELAHHANDVGRKLGQGLTRLPGVRLAWPVQANEVFAVMPRALAEWLRARGAIFYDWPAYTLPESETLSNTEVLVRLVASYGNSQADVDALLTEARNFNLNQRRQHPPS